MRIPAAPAFLPALLLVTLAGLACEVAEHHTIIGPSGLTTGATLTSRVILVQPAAIDAQVVPGAFCPAAAPFLAPLTVVIRTGDGAELVLDEVRTRFADNRGFGGAFTTLTRRDLHTRFGSTVVPAFGTRAFPFSFPFGCIGTPAGTLTIVVVAVDAFGRDIRRSFDLAVRVGGSR